MKQLRDPSFWQSVRTEEQYAPFRTLIRDKYEAFRFEGNIPEISFHTWLSTERDGDPNPFWEVFIRRRRSLSYTALMALIYPEEPLYIRELQDVIWAVCNEYSWVLPANEVFSTGGLNDFMDLFASETAFVLAETSVILGDRLHRRIHERIRQEVKWRILRNMQREPMLWESAKNNWASVCGCNVGGAILYLFPEEFDAMLTRLQKTAFQSFYDSYSEEGTCHEGLDYWHYGLATFVWFADLIFEHTEGKVDLLDREKARRMACFGRRCFLRGDTLISFADSPRKGRIDPGFMHRLQLRFPGDVKPVPRWMTKFWEGNTPWLQVTRNLIWLDPAPPEGTFEPVSMDLPDSAQALVAAPGYSLAVRGGDNSFDLAQHCDIGGFIFSTDEGQIFCDPGAGLYSRDYFDPALRGSCFGASSLVHNVPRINGEGQKSGIEFSGPITHTGNRIEVELSGAYGQENLTRFTRVLTHTDEKVTLTDSFDPNEAAVTEHFVTLLPPRAENGVIRIGASVLEYDSALTPVIGSVTGEMHTHAETFYTIDFDLPRDMDHVTFVIRP